MARRRQEQPLTPYTPRTSKAPRPGGIRPPAKATARRRELTASLARELLDYDPATGLLSWRHERRRVRVGDLAGTVDGKFAPAICIDYRSYSTARVVWLHQTGSWPRGSIVHCDGDAHNNRMENLRDSRENYESGRVLQREENLYGALQLANGRWRAQSYDRARKQPVNLGTYDTATEASAVASAYRDNQKETPE